MLASDMLITLTETNPASFKRSEKSNGWFSFKLSIWGPFKGLPFFFGKLGPVNLSGSGKVIKKREKNAPTPKETTYPPVKLIWLAGNVSHFLWEIHLPMDGGLIIFFLSPLLGWVILSKRPKKREFKKIV